MSDEYSFFAFSVPTPPPVPQPRPKIRVIPGKKGRKARGQAYVPSSHPIHEYRDEVAYYAKARNGGPKGLPPKPADGAVGVSIVFTLPRPKSHYGTGRNAGKLKSSAPEHHTGPRADIDNLVKAVLDALTGIIYHDDGQVVRVFAAKHYEEAPGHADTHITIYTLEP